MVFGAIPSYIHKKIASQRPQTSCCMPSCSLYRGTTVPRGGWPRLTFGHQGRLMNGSHVRNRGAQIEESGIFSLAV